MTDIVKVALIGACGVVVSGGLSTLVVVLIKRLEVKVDGRLTELVGALSRADRAEGHAEGVTAEQDRTKGT